MAHTNSRKQTMNNLMNNSTVKFWAAIAVMIALTISMVAMVSVQMAKVNPCRGVYFL